MCKDSIPIQFYCIKILVSAFPFFFNSYLILVWSFHGHWHYWMKLSSRIRVVKLRFFLLLLLWSVSIGERITWFLYNFGCFSLCCNCRHCTYPLLCEWYCLFCFFLLEYGVLAVVTMGSKLPAMLHLHINLFFKA